MVCFIYAVEACLDGWPVSHAGRKGAENLEWDLVRSTVESYVSIFNERKKVRDSTCIAST